MDVIFVHGALVRDGAWWWRRTAELLEERTGIGSRSVALPSCGEAASEDRGLVADAAALRAVLDEVDSAIVVGHSYGGTVIAEVGAHPAVAHVVLVSSYLPEVGQSQGAIMSGEADPVSIGEADAGSIAVTGYDEQSFAARFLQDADAEAQRGGWERVTAQHLESFTTPTSAAGRSGVESTYLVCAEDRSTSVELQRLHAARATRSVELPTGHHPFLSRPDLVASELEGVLARL
ncbi:alpha/beta hydrolase [Rathayibacter sp. Leaf185]|nr:alpha/beta hydrolase [Rathayibacter sp. Leaf294]KQS12233.1 alpha/beta hydrolase [Rathayibacter sp. Leaf185]